MTLQEIVGNGLRSSTLQLINLAGAGGCDNNGSLFPAYIRGVDTPDVRSFGRVSFRSVLYVNL